MTTQTKTTWRTMKLGEVVEIIDGDRGENYPGNGELLTSGYSVFLNTKNVSGTKFDFSNVQFISEERDHLLRKGRLERGDFVLTTRGTIGNIAYYGKDIQYDYIRINSGMVILRPRQNAVDVRFLNLFLAGQAFKNQTVSLQSGSAQPQLPIRDLQRFEIDLPPLNEQSKISDILWPFDEKIENNSRIIKTLEEMAQAVFKEWFVKFRFPGYKKVEFVDSELGKIPKGWKIGKIKDIVSVISGYPFSSKLYNAKLGLGVVTIKNVQDGKFIIDCNTFIKEEKLPSNLNPECRLKDGDIVLSLTGNVGRVCFVYGGEYLLNQRVAKLIPKRSSDFAYCYFLFRQGAMQNYMINMAKGSAQPNLSPVEIAETSLVLSSSDVLDAFSEIARSIYERILNNSNENQKLAVMRDLLLPRLMSGEIKT